jgi:hypothetical protein
MYVCVYVCTNVCASDIWRWTEILYCMFVCMCMYVYVCHCMYVCQFMYVSTHVCMCARGTFGGEAGFCNVCMYVYLCMYVCLYGMYAQEIFIVEQRLYVCMLIHAYTHR